MHTAPPLRNRASAGREAPAPPRATKPRPDAGRRAWSSVYLLATLLVLEPLGDLLSQVWPLQPDVMIWRYGFLGLLGNNLLTPLLGASLAMVAAAYLGHARTQRVLSIACVLLTLTLIAALAGFVLDALQLRRTVRPELASRYDIGAAIAAAKYAASILGFAMLGRTRLRGGRDPAPQAPQPSQAQVVVH